MQKWTILANENLDLEKMCPRHNGMRQTSQSSSANYLSKNQQQARKEKISKKNIVKKLFYGAKAKSFPWDQAFNCLF